MLCYNGESRASASALQLIDECEELYINAFYTDYSPDLACAESAPRHCRCSTVRRIFSRKHSSTEPRLSFTRERPQAEPTL